MTLEDEVTRIGELLETEDLVPYTATTAFAELSDEAKDEYVARLARRLEPPPAGRVLARLPFVVTGANRDDMTAIFLANLRSPDPTARRASLAGLDAVEYPNVTDFALASLRDDDDQVVAAAAQVLIERVDQPRVRGMLADLPPAHRDDPEFHVTRSLLEAHGIGEQ
jgi:hypothetical protein